MLIGAPGQVTDTGQMLLGEQLRDRDQPANTGLHNTIHTTHITDSANTDVCVSRSPVANRQGVCDTAVLLYLLHQGHTQLMGTHA